MLNFLFFLFSVRIRKNSISAPSEQPKNVSQNSHKIFDTNVLNLIVSFENRGPSRRRGSSKHARKGGKPCIVQDNHKI